MLNVAIQLMQKATPMTPMTQERLEVEAGEFSLQGQLVEAKKALTAAAHVLAKPPCLKAFFNIFYTSVRAFLGYFDLLPRSSFP